VQLNQLFYWKEKRVRGASLQKKVNATKRNRQPHKPNRLNGGEKGKMHCASRGVRARPEKKEGKREEQNDPERKQGKKIMG